MASTDIREFLFYFKYLWSPADFLNLQTWLQETTAGIAEGLLGAGVLAGLQVTPGGALNLSIAPGICTGDEGQLMVNGAIITQGLTAPTGAIRKDLVVMRPTVTPTTNIPQPDNPSNIVPLHQILGFQLVIIQGVEGSGVYPAKQDGDCVLMGYSLTPGQSVVGISDLDRQPMSLPKKRTHPYRVNKTSASVQTSDDHIDWDCSASACLGLLPSAAQVPGQDFTIVKIDNSANQLSVSGADPMSGQNQIILDSQWQTLHVRSTGTAWRVL